MLLRLAVVATHPIQYQAPLFRALAKEPDLAVKVFYGALPDEKSQGVGFGVPFRWDVPLLEGYDWTALSRRRSRVASLREGFTGFRPDAVLLLGWGTPLLLEALRVARSMRLTTLVRGDSNLFKRRPWPMRAAHRALFRLYDGFLVVGKANGQLYQASGVSPERLFPCPHFVDNERFRRQSGELRRDRAQLRRSFDIPDGAVCFLFAGKLQKKKRLPDLLEALARLERESHHLLVVGDGPLRRHAQRMAADRGLSVTFAGFLNQTKIARAYVAADCLVLPSDAGETWGLVVNEAMACGLPVIVSDHVGCGPDLVEQDVTGDVFPLGDVLALARALARMSDEQRRARLGDAARARIARYSVGAAVSGLVSATRRLLEISCVG